MQSVVILGGGVAGLTAAHELAERGFQVRLYERNHVFGGKARSLHIPGTGKGNRRDLPSEHGFRFYASFYKHLPHTMRRIPLGYERTAYDNLEVADTFVITQYGKPPFKFPAHFPRNGAQWEFARQAARDATTLGVTREDARRFARVMLNFLATCQERRDTEYDATAWSGYSQVDRLTPTGRNLLVTGLTRAMVGMKANDASTRTIGTILNQLYLNLLTPGAAADIVMNAPTNDAWIDPWIAYLQAPPLSVELHNHTRVTRLVYEEGRITGAEIATEECDCDGRAEGPSYGRGRPRRVVGTERVTADLFLSALPVEVIARLTQSFPAEVRSGGDTPLENLEQLRVSWMNGIQYYLERDIRSVYGQTQYADSPWALSSVMQQQLWKGVYLPSEYGDGRLHGLLSVDISDWDTRAPRIGKKAKDCSPAELAKEAWEQMREHLALGEPEERLGEFEDDCFDYFIDPSIEFHGIRGDLRGLQSVGEHVEIQHGTPAEPGSDGSASADPEAMDETVKEFDGPQPLHPAHADYAVETDPLLVNTVGSWPNRPYPATVIPNLFLAGDYVRTYTQLACMEGANEGARRAVNVILEATDSIAPRCQLWPLEEPPSFEPLKAIDRRRHREGLPAVDYPLWMTVPLLLAGIGFGVVESLLQRVLPTRERDT